MKQFLFFALSLLISFNVAHSQFSDDFSTGVLDSEWVGDRGKFVIENEILRLDDNEAGSAYLARPSQMVEETQWDFWVRISFTPSDNNYPLIYLVSDNSDLSGSLNGYFIRIGKSGAENNRLFFYRQDGNSQVELLTGSDDIASASNNIMRFRVTRDNNGNWDFYVDPAGGEMFLPQGSVHDDTYADSDYFGIKCVYTITNSDRFYFDDITVGDIIPDLEKPFVKYLVARNSTTLDVHFNKALDVPSAESVSNYFVQGIGAPTLANRVDGKPYLVRLMFPAEFTEQTNYNIIIEKVEDVFGNEMDAFSGNFQLYYPQKHDIVFNEIMPNPTPPIELPPYKYIEFHNTSEYQISLEGWSFKSGSDSSRELPFGIIPPNGYILLVNDADLQYFSDFDNVISSNLGVNFLTISGRTLVLYDANGDIMHTISYTDKWYNDPSKDDGGWAIEQIDPYNFCGGINNWRASVDPRGGTPLETNSVDEDNPDEIPPDLLRAGFTDPYNIFLVFSEPMDEESLSSVDYYNIDNGIGAPANIELVAPAFQKVKLQLSEPLQNGIIYNVSVAQSLADCAGNPINKNYAKVAIPELADSMDVVVNELLFNSPTGVPRYIELYNRSQKVIDLSKYRISSKDTVENILTGIRNISTNSYLLFPDDYAVLTTNTVAVMEHYPYNNPEAFIQIETMPSMTNAHGIVAFSHQSHKIIDMIAYTEDMHYALLTNLSGVALERLNPNRPTQDYSNWHSAAERIGFGSPGLKNSQYTENLLTQDDPIEIYPEIFSPDNTGHNDVLNIAYEFDEPGYTANITIFDSRGRPVKTLTRSELLGTSGVITWDGTTDDNQKAYIGIYIVHVEVFDPRGNVKHYKKPAVLAGKL